MPADSATGTSRATRMIRYEDTGRAKVMPKCLSRGCSLNQRFVAYAVDWPHE